MRLRFGRSAAVLLAAGLLAAACGDDGSSSDTTVGTTPVTEDTTVTTEAPTTTEAVTTTAPTATTTATTVAATTTKAAGTATTATTKATTTTAATTTAPATSTTAAGVVIPSNINTDAAISVAWLGPNSSMDPATSTISSDQSFQMMVFDRLTRRDNDGSIKPMLATSWQFINGGKTLELKMRNDVKFWDGAPVDANAVKQSLLYIKASTGSLASFLAGIASIDVPDQYTVRINFSAGGAEMPSVLATGAAVIMSPNCAGKVDMRTDPGNCGSGPYKVKEFKANDHVTFERAVDPGKFWIPTEGWTKTITINYAPTPGNVNGALSGAYDSAQVSGASVITAVQQADAKSLGTYGQWVTVEQGLYFNSKSGPLTNAKLREAIYYAYNKDAVATGLYEGNCQANYSPMPPGHWAQGTKANTYSYDLAKAKAAVAASGVSNPSLKLGVAAGSSFAPLAPITQALLKEAGINVDIIQVPQVQVDTQFFAGAFDLVQGAITPSGDPSTIVDRFLSPTGYYKLMPDPDGSIAKLGNDAANPNLTQAQRGALYDDLWTRANQAFVLLSICNTRQMYIFNPKIQGMNATTPFIVDGLVEYRSITKKK